MGTDRDDNILLTQPHPIPNFIAVRENWFEEYICNYFGIIKDCNLAEVLNNWTELNILQIEETEGEEVDIEANNNKGA